MREIRFLTENLALIKQATAAWAMMFAEVVLFALLATILMTFGNAKEQCILISLIVVSLPAVVAQMILHGYVRRPAQGRHSWIWSLFLPLPSIYRAALSAIPVIIFILDLIFILITGILSTPFHTHSLIYDK